MQECVSKRRARGAEKPLNTSPSLHKSSGLMQRRGSLAHKADATVKKVGDIVTLVDPMLADNHKFEVVIEDGVPMDAFLNQVDAAKNANKYYMLQLLRDRSDGAYHVWTRWGRNGEAQKFQNQLKSASDLASAARVFHSTFKSKTGVAWSSRRDATPGRPGMTARPTWPRGLDDCAAVMIARPSTLLVGRIDP